MARCEDCTFYEPGNELQHCNHPYAELNPFGFELFEEIDCDAFENVASSHESIVDMVVHEDIELFIFGGR